VQRMLNNLLDNALRHGGGAVDVRTLRNGSDATICVMDRGEALGPDEIALLGRAFFRTPAARARRAGAGLGLAIARRVAEMHAGTLRAYRREGGGLIAEVRLPVADAPDRADPSRGVSA
jgi:signal transduction histidine kinase